MDVTEINPGRSDVNVNICLDGFWLSPRFNIPIPTNTRFGLCGGRYWGLGNFATDNENAIMFMRTPEGTLGLSSLFHKTSDEDFVLYFDHDLQTMSIRRATVEFKEYPWKYEVSVGKPSAHSFATVSGTTITPDPNQNRTKVLYMEIPFGQAVMLFSIGTAGNYYGTTITGEGDLQLLGFEKTGVPQDPELYKYKGNPVSPIYEYTVGQYSRTRARHVHLSVKTSDGPIIVNSPTIPISLGPVKIDYINDNQVIEEAQLFDIFELDDDELLILMGRKFNPFSLENPDDPEEKKSNSSADGTNWPDSSGIFLIGSKDTGISWGNPIKPFKEDDQYGLLVLEDANYCCAIHNSIADEMVILFVSSKGGATYLGAFIVSLVKLPYKNFKCTPEGGGQPFLWRPPALTEEDGYVKLVKDNFVYDPEEVGFQDELVIIASEDGLINPDIEVSGVTDFGTLSTHTLSDGRMIIFYENSDGIKMLFSEGSGRSWKGSDIILARNGKSAVYTGGLLIYITDEGIVSKVMTETVLTEAFQVLEGTATASGEIIQNTFDNLIVASLDTGPVPVQKLSAHSDDTGVFHVFYYDDDGRLCSTQGTDVGWKTTNNF
jgi:hypothetical protein